MNIGIIGAGAWTAELLKCFVQLRGVQVTAIQNRTVEKADHMAKSFGILNVHGTIEELCKSSDVDAVIVATHESAHLESTCCALDAGKDVFVEKPMADTCKSAQRMTDRAKQMGRVLMPGHIVRFTAQCQAAKQRLKNAGRVRAIRCFQHRAKSMYANYCKPHIAITLMIHHLDLCRWFADCEVANVYSTERFDLGEHHLSAIWATLEFDNGAVATLQTAWNLDSEQPIFFGLFRRICGCLGMNCGLDRTPSRPPVAGGSPLEGHGPCR